MRDQYILNPPKKFYFLEYFYILLKSVELSNHSDNVLEHFRTLTKEHRLGKSRYKKITVDDDPRLQYTFKQILSEALLYKLVEENKQKNIVTTQGSVPKNEKIG